MNDQRGLGIVGNRDLGAFESQGFTLTADPASTPQSTTVDTDFTNPLNVIVTANNPDEPVANGIVSFLTPTTGASLAGADVQMRTIDGSGVASLVAKANTVSGDFNHEYLVTATTAGATTNADFTLQNLAAAIANLTINSGNNQNTVVNTPFTQPLTLTATDQFGNLVPNATINLMAPGTGASLKTPNLSLITDRLGKVNTILTANTIAGGFTVNLTANTANNSLTLTNLADVPNSFTIVSGNNQSTVVNTAFRDPLTVQVFDRYNNLVPNAQVNVIVPGSGASLNTPSFSLVTDRTGQASTSLTANTRAGNFDLALNLDQTNANRNVPLSNLADQAAIILPVSGDGQTTNVGATFADPLKVKVTDQYGNPIANFPVTFQVQQGTTGAIAILENMTSTTDPSGIAQVPLRANGIGGSYRVLANGQGLNKVAFNLENIPLNESTCPPDCGTQTQEDDAKTTGQGKEPSLNTGNTLNQNATVSQEQTFSNAEVEQTAEYSNYLGIDPVTP
jgi:hypothetical protein